MKSRRVISFSAPSLRRFLLGSVVSLGLGYLPFAALAEEKTPSQLEAEYDREQNPKNRVTIAVELIEERLEELRSAYQKESADRVAAVRHYLSALDRLDKAAEENSNGGAAKKAEIRLREQIRALENLKMNISARQRNPIEKAMARVVKLHEEILYSIMMPSSR